MAVSSFFFLEYFITLHCNVTDKGKRQDNIVLDALQAQVGLEALETSLREGIAVDVVHNVHHNLREELYVSDVRL